MEYGAPVTETRDAGEPGHCAGIHERTTCAGEQSSRPADGAKLSGGVAAARQEWNLAENGIAWRPISGRRCCERGIWHLQRHFGVSIDGAGDGAASSLVDQLERIQQPACRLRYRIPFSSRVRRPRRTVLRWTRTSGLLCAVVELQVRRDLPGSLQLSVSYLASRGPGRAGVSCPTPPLRVRRTRSLRILWAICTARQWEFDARAGVVTFAARCAAVAAGLPIPTRSRWMTTTCWEARDR